TGRGKRDGPAGVGAYGSRKETRGDPRPRAARRSARDVSRPPRVVRIAVMRIVAERTHRELRHVELAQADRTRPEETSRGRASLRRGEVLGHPCAAGGGQPFEMAEILEADGNPVEWTTPAPPRRLGLEGARGTERAFFVERDEGTDTPVPLPHPLEAALDRLHRRQLPRPDGLRDGRQALLRHGEE